MNKIPETKSDEFAKRYREAATASDAAGIAAEPEAQLTTPMARLIGDITEVWGSPNVVLVREQQLDGSRPDFAAVIDGRLCGWIELKRPDIAIDEPSTWTGHNGKQWLHLKELDNLLLSNGREIRWFRLGEQVEDTVLLPYAKGDWDSTPFEALLRKFFAGRVSPVNAVSVLAKRLAPLAKDLRDKIFFVRTNKGMPGYAPARNAHDAWKGLLKEDATPAEFADSVAQVVAYGLVIAALEGKADADKDGFISLNEARDALHDQHALLSAALAPVLGMSGFLDSIQLEVAAIERLVSGVDALAIRQRKDPRGEPWLWFYEDFLAAYDPAARQKAGVYYTPIEVVSAMTGLVEDVLVDRFGKALGFADDLVTTLDPACGTGTFPLAVIDRAAATSVSERGPAGESMAASTLGRNLFGFELLPGPYAVAHLRIGERLRELGGIAPEGGINVLLADTLASPNGDASGQAQLWGDAAVLANERRRAQEVKKTQPVMVAIGNPPYLRVDRESEGGWVLHGDAKTPAEQAPFASVVARANEHTIFSHRRSLYNLYAYFWRWAMWKVFESGGAGPAVVSFITGSSWIGGAGFIGLRELAHKHSDDIYVLDLGGSNRGATKDENVFAIESPVAIVTLVRDDRSDGRKKARVHYSRVEGSSSAKRARLSEINSLGDVRWTPVTPDDDLSFVPANSDTQWTSLPEVTQLMPWQQPGCILARLWPVAPDPGVPPKRWDLLMESSSLEERAARFVTPSTGRNIESTVNGLPRIADLPRGTDAPKIARYAWRSFDRQWVLEDPRVAALERPSLWQSRSNRQIFLAIPSKEVVSEGPAATVSADVPDFHYFCGRGGKDIVPLYRDADGLSPNVTAGLLEALCDELGVECSAEDVAAYIYCVLTSSSLRKHFSVGMGSPGLRIPITRDAALWSEAVAMGSRLLWLHTFAERFQAPEDGRGSSLPKRAGLGWVKAVSEQPKSISDIKYAASTETLYVGDGEIHGVPQEVWEFSISGMEVVKKWLGYRTSKGVGRAATRPQPLDHVRPETWLDAWNDELLELLRALAETVSLSPGQADLVDNICNGQLLDATRLPKPSDAEKAPPKAISSGQLFMS